MPYLLAGTAGKGLEEGSVPGQVLFLQGKVVTSQGKLSKLKSGETWETVQSGDEPRPLKSTWDKLNMKNIGTKSVNMSDIMVCDCLGIGKNNYFSLGSADQIKSFFIPQMYFWDTLSLMVLWGFYHK